MTPQTIIGIFETTEEAENARAALLANGFEGRSIKLDNHVDTVDELVTDGQMTDTTEKTEHLQGAEKQGAILTVQVSDPENMNLATDILNDHGAMDINEFSRSGPD